MLRARVEEEGAALFEVVGVDEINVRVVKFLPGGGIIWCRPEAKLSMLSVGAACEFAHDGALVCGDGSVAVPGEGVLPFGTDEGDEGGWGVGVEIGKGAVAGDDAVGLAGDEIAGIVAGEDDGDGAFVGLGVREVGEERIVWREDLFESRVGGDGVGFEVDQ